MDNQSMTDRFNQKSADCILKKVSANYLKRRFPWLRHSQVLRIVDYFSFHRGVSKHWKEDLLAIGRHCIERLDHENRLRAEGLSAKSCAPKRARTDLVLMGHKKSKSLDRELWAVKCGVLPHGDELDDLLD